MGSNRTPVPSMTIVAMSMCSGTSAWGRRGSTTRGTLSFSLARLSQELMSAPIGGSSELEPLASE
jgi:hypothetical protein